jgi:hypothetical protein
MLFASGIAVAAAAFESTRRRDRSGEIAASLRLARWGVLLVLAVLVLMVFKCRTWHTPPDRAPPAQFYVRGRGPITDVAGRRAA